jgi:hypothetical protein
VWRTEGYITVGLYEDGRPGEVFIKMSKEGSTLSGVMDGLALTVSIGLQYGVASEGVRGQMLLNHAVRTERHYSQANIRFVSSVLDSIARWLGGRFHFFRLFETERGDARSHCDPHGDGGSGDAHRHQSPRMRRALPLRNDAQQRA